MILAKTMPLDGQHVRRFRFLHLRFEWGVWYEGVWYWDKPRFLGAKRAGPLGARVWYSLRSVADSIGQHDPILSSVGSGV